MEAFNSQRLSKWFSRSYFSPPATGSSQKNVGSTERAISAFGGILLSYWGLKKKNLPGVLAAAAGSTLLYRGISGYCPINERIGRDTAIEDNNPIEISTSLQINKPKEMLYKYWRRLENLPNFMDHLEEVTQMGEGISLWVARIPRGLGDVEWEARITAEEENRLLAWRSLPGSEIDNAGEVRFRDAPNGRGTIVETSISYRPPAGDIGEYAAKLLNPTFRRIVQGDLKNFKRFVESGEYENEIYGNWEESESF